MPAFPPPSLNLLSQLCANQKLRIVHRPSDRIGQNDNHLENIMREFLRAQNEAAFIGSGPTAQFDFPNGPMDREFTPNKRRKIQVLDEARDVYAPLRVEQHQWAVRA